MLLAAIIFLITSLKDNVKKLLLIALLFGMHTPIYAPDCSDMAAFTGGYDSDEDCCGCCGGEDSRSEAQKKVDCRKYEDHAMGPWGIVGPIPLACANFAMPICCENPSVKSIFGVAGMLAGAAFIVQNIVLRALVKRRKGRYIVIIPEVRERLEISSSMQLTVNDQPTTAD